MDLKDLTLNALNRMLGEIRTEFEALQENADENVEQIEALADRKSEIDGELARRAELADRQSRAMAAFEDAAPADAPQDDVAPVDADEASDETPDEDESSDDSGDDSDDASDEEASEEMSVEQAAITQAADAIDVADEPVTTLADNAMTAAERAGAMQNAAPADRGDTTLVGGATDDVAGWVSTGDMRGYGGGDSLSIEQLADGFTKTRNGMGTIKTDGGAVVLAQSKLDDSNVPTLGGDALENFETLIQVGQETVDAFDGPNGLVASGAPCLPVQNDYSFFRLSSVQRPVEQYLPRVAAPQGAIRYIVPPDWSYLAQGISIKTCAEEGVEPYVDKSVVRVNCPDLQDCCVSSVSRILEFNNLTFRAFQGFTREAIYQLGVQFAAAKEIMYLDDIDAESVPVNSADHVYGANRDVFSRLATAAYAYRKRHNMRMEAPLVLLVHDSIKYLKAIDAFVDGRMSFGRDPEGTMRTYLSKINVALQYTYHLPTAATAENRGAANGTTGFADPQAADTDLNALPTEITGYLFAPGTFIRLDHGVLDLGLVRDSVLNRSNDLHLFAEQWTKVCKIGYESVKLPLAVCPNGSGAGDITPITCPPLV